MEHSIARRIRSVGFLAATVTGLVAIQLLYDWLMPPHLKVGQLMVSSFIPFAYPMVYWLAHLVLTIFLLGGMAWLFKLRGAKLLRYLLLMYVISLLGPLWMFLVDIYLLPARRPY